MTSEKWVEEVKKQMAARHFSQQHLADRASMSRSTVSRILSSQRNPSQYSRRRIEEALGMRQPRGPTPADIRSLLLQFPELTDEDIEDCMNLLHGKFGRHRKDHGKHAATG